MKTFQEDFDFLKQYTDVIVLEKGDCKLLLCPEFQGRVLTSTSEGWQGKSNGWINYDLIASGQTHPFLNAYGGEDRIWLGPEAGQFGLFFKNGEPFDVAHAKTPAALDREAFDIQKKINKTGIQFNKKFSCLNYSNYEFHLELNRKVQLLDDVDFLYNKAVENIQYIGYRSQNKLTNKGNEGWSKETGLLSLWSIGMFPASPNSQVIIPLDSDNSDKAGKTSVSSYFSVLNEGRLKTKDGVLYFLGDGNFRSKIGIQSKDAGAFICGLDLSRQSLSIIRFKKSDETDFVNSLWEIQDKPYGGDLLNSYNDGPNDKGESLGVFYELESSSPALQLQSEESYTHWQEIWHFSAEPEKLLGLLKDLIPNFQAEFLFGNHWES